MNMSGGTSPSVGMLPARQHLEAVEPAGGEIDLLLVIRHESRRGGFRCAGPASIALRRLQLAFHARVEPG